MSDIILNNGVLEVRVAEPGKEYRRSRYDWNGMILQVTLQGRHTFFPDAQVEDMGGRGLFDVFEFKNTDHYDQTELADRFPLIGVGLLKKEDPQPFCFFREYDVLPFQRSWQQDGQSLIFYTYPLISQGIAVRQEKKLTLNGNSLTVSHYINNVGNKRIELQNFCHNFFQFDHMPIDENYVLHLPYKPAVDVRRGLLNVGFNTIALAQFDCNDPTAAFVMHGYEELQNSGFVLENQKAGTKVIVDEDFRSIRSYNWVCENAFCPETFCDITLEPGESMSFSRTYTFCEM